MYILSQKDIARFWMKVKKADTCWEWQGSCFTSGYGRFTIKRKNVRAHKISYYLHNGNISNEMFICHSCDNPKCVNPSHLWLGTPKENTQDMIKKGRLVRDKPKKYKNIGISLRKETGKWRARYMYDYKNHLIGEFNTQEEAISAREQFIRHQLSVTKISA